MIRHIVLVQCKPATAEIEIAAILDGLSALVTALPGADGFTGGRSDSPENMERGYTHGFTVDFTDRAALAVYADHPEHRALGARLVTATIGGRDGILVVDLDLPR